MSDRNRQVIERRDRIGLGPQPHATGLESRVAVVEIGLAVEPRLHAIAHSHDADSVPLPERRRLHARARQLPASSVVRVQSEIALERIGSDGVVLAVVEAEDDAARGIFPAGDRLELHRHVDVGVRAQRGHDDVEFVLGRPLDEHSLAARRAGHVLHRPLAVHRRPAFDAFGLEIELVGGHGVGHFELLGRGRRGQQGPPGDHERGQRGCEHPSAREIHDASLSYLGRSLSRASPTPSSSRRPSRGSRRPRGGHPSTPA